MKNKYMVLTSDGSKGYGGLSAKQLTLIEDCLKFFNIPYSVSYHVFSVDEYGKEKVLDAAIVSCICGDGSPTNILMSIRTDTVKELFESLPDVSTFDEEKKQIYNAMRDEFVRIISKTA